MGKKLINGLVNVVYMWLVLCLEWWEFGTGERGEHINTLTYSLPFIISYILILIAIIGMISITAHNIPVEPITEYAVKYVPLIM